MKEILKRLRLSQYMLIFQIVTMIISLVLLIIGNELGEIISLACNVVCSIAVLIAFFAENTKNVKYHEVTGQFIFNTLNGSFSAFMDFLMSENFREKPFSEQTVFHEKLVETAKEGSYDTRRKISRALPELYELDKRMTLNIISILRDDIDNERTDIRRRTVEAILTILQKQPKQNKQWKLFKKFENFLKYNSYDDSYTIVACIETYFYVYQNIAKRDKRKQKILIAFENLIVAVRTARTNGIGCVDENLAYDINGVWKVLESLNLLRDMSNSNYATSKEFIDGVLAGKSKFAKLAIVKNLCLTCKGYPDCLTSSKCSVNNSSYMLNKILDFLVHAPDDDVFLSMPTVRYFDCVCNNLNKADARKISRRIIAGYFANENLLIPQTAFDKFAKLICADRDFAKEQINQLLENLELGVRVETEEIKATIASLPQEKQSFYEEKCGRVKFKQKTPLGIQNKFAREDDEDLQCVDNMIKRHHEKIRFIGKIKQLKEQKKL